MGILSAHRNLLSNSKSQLKYLSSSSNLWFIRRISSLPSPAGSSKAKSHAPTCDLKSSNKRMLLIEHFHYKSGNESSPECLSQFPPYNYSIISAENSWKDHHNRCNPFSRYGDYVIAGSCNELMLILFYNVDTTFTRYGKYLLWNPTTDKTTILPPPGPTFENNHGFGFNSESQDYKVIRFPLYMFAKDPEDVIDDHFKLYSLKTNSWKKIAYLSCGVPFPRPPVHVDGVCYWLARTITSDVIIVSFDFATEKFSSPPHIPRPPRLDEHSKGIFYYCAYDFSLVEFDGSLAALVHSELGNERFIFEVWGWNGESWLERMSRTTIVVPGSVNKVVGLFQNDKLFLQDFDKGELLLFDCAKGKMENLGIRAELEMVKIFPFNAGSSVHEK